MCIALMRFHFWDRSFVVAMSCTVCYDIEFPIARVYSTSIMH